MIINTLFTNPDPFMITICIIHIIANISVPPFSQHPLLFKFSLFNDYIMKSGAFNELSAFREGFDNDVKNLYQDTLKYIQAAALSEQALDAMHKYGIIGKVEYYLGKREAHDMSRQGVKFLKKIPKIYREKLKSTINSQVDSYLPQKAAAFFLGVLGIAMVLISSKGITGAVIGELTNTYYGILGGSFLLIALLIFLLGNKKSKEVRNF